MADAETPLALQPEYQPEDLFVYTDDTTRYGEPEFYIATGVPELSFSPFDDTILSQYTGDVPLTSDLLVSSSNSLALPSTTAQETALQIASTSRDQPWNNMVPSPVNNIQIPTKSRTIDFGTKSKVANVLFEALSRPGSPMRLVNGRVRGPTRKDTNARLKFARIVALCMLAFKDKPLLASEPIFFDPSAMAGWLPSMVNPQLTTAPTLAVSRPAKRALEDPDLTLSRKRQRHQRIPGGYPCVLCDGIFDTFADCNKHKRNVHVDILGRPHPCPHCEKAFCTPKDLRRHEKTHARKASPSKLDESEAVPIATHAEASHPLKDGSETNVGDSLTTTCHTCQAHLHQLKYTPEYIDIVLAENQSLQNRCRDLEREAKALRALVTHSGSVG